MKWNKDYAKRKTRANSFIRQSTVAEHERVSYTFPYDIYGAIDTITLPTGGYEKYEYTYIAPVSSPINFKFVYAQGNRGVTKHIVSPSGLVADETQWLYSGNGPSVIMTAPDGSRTETFLWTDGVTDWGYSANSSRAGRPYEERVYAPGGQMLRRKLIDWAMTPSNATGNLSGTQVANRNARMARQVEIMLDTSGPALAKTTTYGYDTTFQYDVGLEQTSISDFDYVELDQNTAQTISLSSIPNGTLLRQTETDYLTSDNNTMTYGYDLAGNLTLQGYPSGRIVTTEYDNLSRIAGVKNQSNGAFYVGASATDATNRIQYSAHGAISPMKFGNTLWEHTNFNLRLQPTQIGVGTSATNSGYAPTRLQLWDHCKQRQPAESNNNHSRAGSDATVHLRCAEPVGDGEGKFRFELEAEVFLRSLRQSQCGHELGQHVT